MKPPDSFLHLQKSSLGTDSLLDGAVLWYPGVDPCWSQEYLTLTSKWDKTNNPNGDLFMVGYTINTHDY